MKNAEIIVTNCKDCIFPWDTGVEGELYVCSFDKKRREIYKRSLYDYDNVFIKFETDKKWCPLKKFDVVIKLKK